MKSYILKQTGEEIPVEPKNGTDFSLKEMQEIVGGYIEMVNGSDGRIIICDEEGKLKYKLINKKASEIFKEAGGGDPIVGNVLICYPNQVK